MAGKRVDDSTSFEFIRRIAIPARVIFHHQRGHGTVLLRIGQVTAIAELSHCDVAARRPGDAVATFLQPRLHVETVPVEEIADALCAYRDFLS